MPEETQKQLLEAHQRGSKEEVNKLLAQGVDVCCLKQPGKSLFSTLKEFGYDKGLNQLAYGALNIQNAIEENNQERLQRILNDWHNESSIVRYGIQNAIEENNHEALQIILAQQPSHSDSLVDLGLKCAIQKNNTEALQIILDQQPSHSDSLVELGIVCAIQENNTEALQIILDQQPSHSDSLVELGIRCAIEQNNMEALEALLNHDHVPSMNDVDIGKYLARNHMPACNIILEAMNNKPDLSSGQALAGFAIALKGENISTFDVIKTMKSEVRRLVEHNLYEGLAYCSAEQLQTKGLLEEVVRLGHFEAAQVLIGQGAEVNGSYLWGASPLQLAQQHSDLRLTRLLLKAGADSQDLSNDTLDKLFTDTEQTLLPIDLVRANLTRPLADCSDDELNQLINNYGQTLLHEAAKYGHLECAQLLVNQGLDIEARNGREQTPLHVAAKYGHSHIVKFLLQQGANYEAKDNHDLKPVDLAAKNNHNPVSHYLKMFQVERSLSLACRQFLGSSLITMNNPNEKPLVRASVGQEGTQKLEKLELGELTKEDELTHRNALDDAIGSGNSQALEILLERARSIFKHMDEQKSSSALHCAVNKPNNTELIELLVSYGWDVNSQQDSGLQRTPLHKAAFWGNRAAVQCLLENGADPNIQDNRNQKPRDLAENLDIAQLIDDYRQQVTADGQANRESNKASLSGNIFFASGVDNDSALPPPEPTEEELDRAIGQLD